MNQRRIRNVRLPLLLTRGHTRAVSTQQHSERRWLLVGVRVLVRSRAHSCTLRDVVSCFVRNEPSYLTASSAVGAAQQARLYIVGPGPSQPHGHRPIRTSRTPTILFGAE